MEREGKQEPKKHAFLVLGIEKLIILICLVIRFNQRFVFRTDFLVIFR
jgi:hypothetical protein